MRFQDRMRGHTQLFLLSALATALLLSLPEVAANTLFDTLGRGWEALGVAQAYQQGGVAARFIDALITFLMVVPTLYQGTQIGKHKLPKTTAMAGAVAIWLPLVIYLQTSNILLLETYAFVAVSIFVVTFGLWRILLGALTPLTGGSPGKVVLIMTLLFSMATVGGVLGQMLYDSRTNGSETQEMLKANMIGAYEASSGFLLVMVIVTLIGTVLRAKHDGSELGSSTGLGSSAKWLTGAATDLWKRKQTQKKKKEAAQDLLDAMITLDEDIDGQLQKQERLLGQLMVVVDALYQNVRALVEPLGRYASMKTEGKKLPEELQADLNERAAQYAEYFQRQAASMTELLESASRSSRELKSEEDLEKRVKEFIDKEDETVDKILEELEKFEKHRTDEVTAQQDQVRRVLSAIDQQNNSSLQKEYSKLIDALSEEIQKGIQLRTHLETIRNEIQTADTDNKNIAAHLSSLGEFEKELEEFIKKLQENVVQYGRDMSESLRNADVARATAVVQKLDSQREVLRQKQGENHAKVLSHAGARNALDRLRQVLNREEKDAEAIPEEMRAAVGTTPALIAAHEQAHEVITEYGKLLSAAPTGKLEPSNVQKTFSSLKNSLEKAGKTHKDYPKVLSFITQLQQQLPKIEGSVMKRLVKKPEAPK